MKFWKLASAATALVFSISANAAVIHTDLSSWMNNTTVSNSIDFNGGQSPEQIVTPSTTIDGVTFSSPSHLTIVNGLSFASYLEDGYLEWQDDLELTINFNTSYSAFSFDFGELSGSVVTFSIIADEVQYDIDTLSNNYNFFGITLDNAISEITISSSNNYPIIDNFAYGNAVSAVPVPAAAWLFGSGLIGLVGLARRKKA